MHWSLPLTHPFTLRSGRKLTTLRDAGDYLVFAAGGVIRDDVLVEATRLVMRAAETGEAEDVEAATGQLGVYLRQAGQLRGR